MDVAIGRVYRSVDAARALLVAIPPGAVRLIFQTGAPTLQNRNVASTVTTTTRVFLGMQPTPHTRYLVQFMQLLAHMQRVGHLISIVCGFLRSRSSVRPHSFCHVGMLAGGILYQIL